jgi:hypothetical protein
MFGLNVIPLDDIMLNVIKLSVIMLIVMQNTIIMSTLMKQLGECGIKALKLIQQC